MYLSICLSVCLSIYLSIHPSIHLSEMKPVYETSSENGSAQVQNVAILCNFVRPQKVQVRSSKTMSSYQCILRFFHPMSLKYCACHEKVIRSTAPVTQNLLSKPEDLMLQNVTHLRTSAPWPPATRNVFFFCVPSSNLHPASFVKLLQSPRFWLTFYKVQNPLRLPHKTTLERPFRLYTFLRGNVLGTTTPCTFSPSQLPKVLRTWGVLYIFTWKCA